MIETRRTLLAALPAGAILSQLASIRRVLAQDDGIFEEQLQYSINIAMELANSVPMERDVSSFLDAAESSEVAQWQERDYEGRRALVLSEASRTALAQTSASLELSQEHLQQFVRPEFMETADEFAKRGVPLIPELQDIERLSTDRTPPNEVCSPAGEVFWDILVDSFELLDEKQLFLEAVIAISGGTRHVEQINGDISEGRWEQAVDALFDLLNFLLEGSVIIELARYFEDRLQNVGLARRFLLAVSKRLVLFVGTGYAIFALSLAVHRHWDRLVCED